MDSLKVHFFESCQKYDILAILPMRMGITILESTLMLIGSGERRA